jgi:hypothetical protein
MGSLWANLIIQLGISGLVVFAGYKIAILMINHWSQAEAERTKAGATAEQARTHEIAQGFRADVEAHQVLSGYMNQQTQILSRLEGKFDAAFDLTPVRGVKEYSMRTVEVSDPGLVVKDDAPSSAIVEPRVVIPPLRKTPTEYSATSKRPKTGG